MIGGSYNRGFTLLELMVVIGIAAVLTALIVPIGKSLREGNRMMTCGVHLRAIHQALKMYFLDERGVPPYYLAPGDDPSQPSTEPAGPGLMALYDMGYLRKKLFLHCPKHRGVSADNPRFFHSYDSRDPLAKYSQSNPLSMLTQYKYLPYRGEDDPNDPDYRRQLCRGVGTTPIYDPTWEPDDSTIVCWCDKHQTSFTRGGVGQYQVLYWSGEVRVQDKTLFQDAGTGPAEAWRVRPED